jgi:hypothetical protein
VARLPEWDATDVLDSSWGEVGFDIRVSAFRDFFTLATAGAARFVPEPQASLVAAVAWALMAACRCARWRQPGS